MLLTKSQRRSTLCPRREITLKSSQRGEETNRWWWLRISAKSRPQGVIRGMKVQTTHPDNKLSSMTKFEENKLSNNSP